MDTIESKKPLPVFEIAKVNLKHHALLSILAASAIIIITPVLFGTAHLDKRAAAAPLEMFVSLAGIVLLTPLFQPEQNKDIDDLVSSKYISPLKIYGIRTVYTLTILVAFISLFGLYMRGQECDVTPCLIVGTAANAIFLGSLGMLAAALSDHTVMGYMTPMVFYAMNYGMGGKLGNFYLFSMSAGDFEPKRWLLVTGVFLMAVSLLVKRLKRRCA